jgi:hypothetical protein
VDFLQNWGPYAPMLLYFWICISSTIAYFRVRKTYTREIATAQLSIAVLALSQSVWPFRIYQENPSTIEWINLATRQFVC